MAAPWLIIRHALGATGDKGDFASSSLLSLGCNKIKKAHCHGRSQTYFAGGGGRGGARGGRWGRICCKRIAVRRAADGGGRGKRWWGMAVDGSGWRQTVADGSGQRRKNAVRWWKVAVVWMMDVGSAINNVWLIVANQFFCPGIARSSFFCPRFARGSRQSKSLTKNPGIFVARKKNDSHIMVADKCKL